MTRSILLFCALTTFNFIFPYLSLQREKLPPRPDVKRGSPVSPQRWSYHMDQDGRVQEKQELIKAVFKGVCRVLF